MKRCILHAEKVCNGCYTCDERCELDPKKICDNCFRCLDEDMPAFSQITISGVYLGDDYLSEREEEIAVDAEDGFVPDLFDNWKREEVVQARTLPMTTGVRVRRAHTKH
jgi:hypothetical protein